jgi:hypothetical protein
MRQNQVAEGTDALLNLVDYADSPPSRRDRGQSFPFNGQATLMHRLQPPRLF